MAIRQRQNSIGEKEGAQQRTQAKPALQGPVALPGADLPGLVRRAVTQPGRMAPGGVQRLQRAFGNRAVTGLLPGQPSGARQRTIADRRSSHANRSMLPAVSRTPAIQRMTLPDVKDTANTVRKALQKDIYDALHQGTPKISNTDLREGGLEYKGQVYTRLRPLGQAMVLDIMNEGRQPKLTWDEATTMPIGEGKPQKVKDSVAQFIARNLSKKTRQKTKNWMMYRAGGYETGVVKKLSNNKSSTEVTVVVTRQAWAQILSLGKNAKPGSILRLLDELKIVPALGMGKRGLKITQDTCELSSGAKWRLRGFVKEKNKKITKLTFNRLGQH